MATNGKVSSNAYDGRYIALNWSLTTQNVKANTSVIAWTLAGEGTATQEKYLAGGFKVVIDGTIVYSTSQEEQIDLYDGTVVSAGNYTLNHNSAGEKDFTVSIECEIVNSHCAGNGTFDLPIINRVSSITTVNGEQTGDDLSVAYIEYVASYTNTLYVTLNDEGILAIDDYRNGAVFNLSEEALTAIYEAVTTTQTVVLGFALETYDGLDLLGVSETVYKEFLISDSNPVIGAVEYADSNADTVAITDDDSYIIRNNSTLTVTVTDLEAINGASLDWITIIGGGLSETRNLSGTLDAEEVFNLGTVNQSANFTLTITLTDSRGFTDTKTVNVLVYDYVAPTATITAERVGNYYTETDVTPNANYASIGGLNTLTITAEYKKTTDPSYGTPVVLTNGVTTQLNLDNTYTWDLKVTCEDLITETVYNIVIGRGLPVWFIDRLKNSIGVNCFPANNNSLEISGLLSVNGQFLVNGQGVNSEIFVGSQEIYTYLNVNTQCEAVLTCAENYDLINGIFTGVTIPTDMRRAYKVTFQYATAGANNIVVSLNNISSENCTTGKNEQYRRIGATRIFKESELILEAVHGYSSLSGLNLKFSNSAAGAAKIWAVTIHGYLVHKDAVFS